MTDATPPSWLWPVEEGEPVDFCYVAGSQCYHRLIWQRFRTIPRRGYWRSICGVIDSARFGCFYRASRSRLPPRLCPCKRCFPEEPSE
jgi:hypothetical protein